MQSHQPSEYPHVMEGQLTVVLFTQDRAAFLARSLQYYRKASIPLLVLDSSRVPYSADWQDFPQVDYQHVPQCAQTGLVAKLRQGLALVDTPYMAFAADNDFPLVTGLGASLGYLQEHADYALCHGYSMMYEAHAGKVSYYRSDRKIDEDHQASGATQRAHDYISQYLTTLFAVSRTPQVRNWLAAMPDELSIEWLETAHAYWHAVTAKIRVLPIPYRVCELPDPLAEHRSVLLELAGRPDQGSALLRGEFADLLASRLAPLVGLEQQVLADSVLDCFTALAKSLTDKRSEDISLIFESSWDNASELPARQFKPVQYVEMPFYNQAFFDVLTELEFFIHALPAGRLQMRQLEGIWTRQEGLLEHHANDTNRTIANRLWQAMDANIFNLHVVAPLTQLLEELGDHEAGAELAQWEQRLRAVSSVDCRELLGTLPSGQLMRWQQARTPTADQAKAIQRALGDQGGGPQFGIFLLDFEQDMDKIQMTLDSLLEGLHQGFKVVVLTTGEPPIPTTAQNTLHFVKVTRSHYIDKLNEVARQSSWDWLILAEVGDQFTTAGLARAALELLAAPECRAVAADEIHRLQDGRLQSVFRPGFNLDLLQSVPALMARHWLVRRDVFLSVGGYDPQFSDALEFDLLLRIIDTGGMGWLAHMDEPLLTCAAIELKENAHERQALIRHLGKRGYQALVNSEIPGTLRIDYRHDARPMVSVILPCQDNLAQLQASLENLRQRTRYINYEVLVVDNSSQQEAMHDWLDQAEQGWNKLRVLRSEQPINPAALYNAASQQAKGEYLVLLDSDAEIVNPNWIESLLNHAQRPEVGVVGAKLINAQGNITQAGLLLGFDEGVGAAFAGHSKAAAGYLQRLVVDQNYSAVSGACLMIGSALFQGVGGLDDDLFAESLSDVDLCLKAGQAGFMTVWTPYAQVIYPGEVVQTPHSLVALRGKWSAQFAYDQAYNRNLSQRGTSFTLGESAPINWTSLLADSGRAEGANV